MANIGTAISMEDFRMDKDIQTETNLGTEMEDLGREDGSYEHNQETELGNDVTAEIDVGNELEVVANDTVRRLDGGKKIQQLYRFCYFEEPGAEFRAAV